jgi:macrodomain Ter protein organizer (MatP/YcbG family)
MNQRYGTCIYCQAQCVQKKSSGYQYTLWSRLSYRETKDQTYVTYIHSKIRNGCVVRDVAIYSIYHQAQCVQKKSSGHQYMLWSRLTCRETKDRVYATYIHSKFCNSCVVRDVESNALQPQKSSESYIMFISHTHAGYGVTFGCHSQVQVIGNSEHNTYL